MKKTLAQQLRTNIKMRMAELDLTNRYTLRRDIKAGWGITLA